MKQGKSILLFATVLSAGFMACKQEVATNAPSQATIDSMVNAKVDSIKLELMAQNDSLINARAKVIADSLVLAAKANGGKVPTVAVAPKPKPTPPKPSTGGVKPAPSTPVVEPTKTQGPPKTVNDRQGSQNSGPKTVNDRQGSQTAAPKTVKDRQGTQK